MNIYKTLTAVLLISFTIQQNIIAQDYEKANQLYEGGFYSKAAAEYEKVIPWLEKELGTNDTTSVPIYNYLLGSSYFLIDQFEKALDVLIKNHNYCSKNFTSYADIHYNTLDQICKIYSQLNDLDQLAFYQKEKINLLNKTDQTVRENLLDNGLNYNELGLTQYYALKFEASVLSYQNALKILEKILPSNDLDLALIRSNISLSYLRTKQFKEAQDVYSKSFEIFYNNDKTNYYNSFYNLREYSDELLNNELYLEASKALQIDINTKRKLISTKDTSLITSYLKLGYCYSFLNDNKKGELYIDSALNIINQNFKEDIPYQYFNRSYAANFYELIQSYEKAIALRIGNLKYYEKEQEQMAYMFLTENNAIIDNYNTIEEYEKAIPYLDKKIDFFSSKKSDSTYFSQYIGALYEKATSFEKLLDVHQAIQILEQTIQNNPSLIQKEPIIYINYLDKLADLYFSISNFPRAIEVNNERIALLEKVYSKSSLEYAVGINDLGIMYVNSGEYIKGLEQFEKAHPTLSNQGYVNKSNSLNNLARCQLELGNYKKAEQIFKESIQTHIENDTLNEHFATALINMGALYLTMKELDKAKSYYLRAKNIISKTKGTKNPYYIITLNSLGEVALNQGQIEESMQFYTEVLGLLDFVYTKEDPTLFEILGSIGRAVCVAQLYEDGISILENVRKVMVAKFGEQNPKTMIVTTNLAFAYFSSGKNDLAYDLIKNQFKTINNNVNYHLKYLSEGESIEYLNQMNVYYAICYSFIKDTKNTYPDLVEIGLNSILQNKGKLLHSNTALRNQVYNSNDSKLIETYKNWLEKLETLNYLENATDIDFNLLDLTKKEAEKLEKILIESSQEFAKALNKEHHWKDIQNALTENDIVVEFIKYNHQEKFISDTVRYAAFIFDKNSETPTFVDICSENELVNIMGKQGGNNLSYIQKIYGKKGEVSKLYPTLWKPLEKYLTEGKQLIIAPDGILHKISFSGISDGNTFLNKKYKLKNVSSATAILNKETTLNSINSILVGGVDYDYKVAENSDKIWNYLEGTQIETQEIAKILKDNGNKVTLLSQESASEHLVLDHLTQNNIAHIATHGFFYPKPSLVQEALQETTFEEDEIAFRGGSRGMGYSFYVANKNPMMRSGIALSGANQVWNKTDLNQENDGVLTAQDIATLDLRSLDLIVLSACETGLGDIEGNEGVFGLQRSLKMAGVNKIIMSLWQVPDKETKEFMILFYQNLIQNKNIESAFKKAQIEMSEKYDAFFWAAFVLI